MLIPEGEARPALHLVQVGVALARVLRDGRMAFRRNLSVAEIACQVRE